MKVKSFGNGRRGINARGLGETLNSAVSIDRDRNQNFILSGRVNRVTIIVIVSVETYVSETLRLFDTWAVKIGRCWPSIIVNKQRPRG